METDATLHHLPEYCPFTFLYMSSEDSRDESLNILSNVPLSSDDVQKQGVSHTPVTAEQVMDSDGQRDSSGWRQVGRSWAT